MILMLLFLDLRVSMRPRNRWRTSCTDSATWRVVNALNCETRPKNCPICSIGRHWASTTSRLAIWLCEKFSTWKCPCPSSSEKRRRRLKRTSKVLLQKCDSILICSLMNSIIQRRNCAKVFSTCYRPAIVWVTRISCHTQVWKVVPTGQLVAFMKIGWFLFFWQSLQRAILTL